MRRCPKIALVALLALLGCIALSCALPRAGEAPISPSAPPETHAPLAPSPTPVRTAQVAAPHDRLTPADLRYLGAFRLPVDNGDLGWTWSGHALAYYPDGDPDGPDDGTPGSLYGTGNDQRQYVSEIGIPAPVLSPGKRLADLPTATTLQPFADVRGDLYAGLDGLDDFAGALAKTGLAYIPAQGKQAAAKLHFCWGYHLQQVPQDEPTLHGRPDVSHGWCELDLSDPRPAGAWAIGDYINFVTTDYLFPIDPAWAAAHTPGMLLATGRFRDGGQGSMGPALYAYGPWLDGDPPPPGAALSAVPLLAYSNVLDPDPHVMDGYAHADEWMGGGWLTAGGRSAVVIVGTKALGAVWYGFADGTVWPEEPPYPPVPAPPHDERGWWAERFVAQFLFYDPADLAAVAHGEIAPWAPQPYAVMDVDAELYHVASPRQWHHLGAAAYDPARALLYVVEPFADEDRSLIHVWRVGQ